MNRPDRVQLPSWQRDELHGVERGGCDAPAMAVMALFALAISMVMTLALRLVP